VAADPTRDEMLTHLVNNVPGADEASEFDREGAIYWFANDWHTGQGSNLYAALCASKFSPGPSTVGPEPDSMKAEMYLALQEEFT